MYISGGQSAAQLDAKDYFFVEFKEDKSGTNSHGSTIWELKASGKYIEWKDNDAKMVFQGVTVKLFDGKNIEESTSVTITIDRANWQPPSFLQENTCFFDLAVQTNNIPSVTFS